MGILRFLLAFAVFNAHAGLPIGFSIVSGATAVHCFFVISGFYMAMVLSEKYSRSQATYFEFVSNRLLRLLPSYLLMLVLTFCLGIALSGLGKTVLPPLDSAQQLAGLGAGIIPLILHAFSQMTLLGQDLYHFFHWSPEAGFGFTPDFQNDPASLHRLLFVPPAWSLSVEIYFYLLAPWLVRLRTSAIVGIIAASFIFRIVLAWQWGWQGDPWSYRFFPSELAFFLAGVLAYRADFPSRARVLPWMFALLALGGALGLADTMESWQPGMPIHRWLRIPMFALLAAGIPALFAATRNWRVDRQIGELSYPLYVSHFLVIWVAGLAFSDVTSGIARVMVVACAILAAIALYKCIDTPIDRFRQARLKKRSPSALKSLEGMPASELSAASGR
ncbi:MAG: acyltransferase family protein [Burkholderiales bacterium]